MSDRELISIAGKPVFTAVGFIENGAAISRGRQREAWMVERYGKDWEQDLRNRLRIRHKGSTSSERLKGRGV